MIQQSMSLKQVQYGLGDTSTSPPGDIVGFFFFFLVITLEPRVE